MIQRSLQDPLAQLLLEGKIGDGHHVEVGATNAGLIIDGQTFATPDDVLAEDTSSHSVH